MAATVEMDWKEGGGIVVSWQSGAQPTKSKDFADRDDAEAFATAKMGARGMIISSLDLTAEQRKAQADRKARLAAKWTELGL